MNMVSIINEIKRLPNLCYVFNGDDRKWHLVMLGGGSAQVIPNTEAYPNWQKADNIQLEMELIYDKKDRTDEDIAKFRVLYNEMLKCCTARKEGTYTISAQERYIEECSNEERQQILKQIEMYKAFMTW